MSAPEANFIVAKEGEAPDPKHAQTFTKAAAAFLKRAATEQGLRLHDLAAGTSYTATHLDDVRLVYLSQVPPGDLEIRSADGSIFKRVMSLKSALEELSQAKSLGLFVPKEDVWLVQPPDRNPQFEKQVGLLRQELTTVDPQSRAEHLADRPTASSKGETYPVEVHEDLDMLPGLTGEKMLNATVNFLGTTSKPKLAVLGALAGMLAYKSMGVKGVIGLLLAVAALKRYINMGSRIVMDERLDLVARGIQQGIPVNKDGQIDPEFLDALRQFPAGNHRLASREVSPAVQARAWETHPLRIDSESFQLDSLSETVSQVMDGDTFSGERGRYRLIGIDTPELVHGGAPQPGARVAWEELRSLIPPGSKVRVEVARNQPALYGRTPCYLYIRDPSDGKEVCVNELLIAKGLARVTNFRPHHPKMKEFVQASLEAISHGRGLWSALYNPLPKPKLFAIEAERSASSQPERFTVSMA
jgi:endonuclease YncB( thermonuclease family)